MELGTCVCEMVDLILELLGCFALVALGCAALLCFALVALDCLGCAGLLGLRWVGFVLFFLC
jgi:hypothetical protein